jgi:hypothetical protein
MPTLDDLNAAFADLESRAPVPGAVGRAPVRAGEPRRARTAVMLLSAAAVVVLTVGVAVAVPHIGADPVDAASGQTADRAISADTVANRVPATSVETAPVTAAAPVGSNKPVPSAATSTPFSQPPAPRTVRVPFRITGVDDLRLLHADFDGTNGGMVVETGSTTWDFGWSMASLSTTEKPATDTVTFDEREWVVQHDRTTGAIVSLWVTAAGFGMTITPTGRDLTLDQYESFLSHVSLAQNLGNPSTWPTADGLG